MLATAVSCCERRPDERQSVAYKSPGDGGFRIQVNGSPASFVPGASYVGEFIYLPTVWSLQVSDKVEQGSSP